MFLETDFDSTRVFHQIRSFVYLCNLISGQSYCGGWSWKRAPARRDGNFRTQWQCGESSLQTLRKSTSGAGSQNLFAVRILRLAPTFLHHQEHQHYELPFSITARRQDKQKYWENLKDIGTPLRMLASPGFSVAWQVVECYSGVVDPAGCARVAVAVSALRTAAKCSRHGH